MFINLRHLFVSFSAQQARRGSNKRFPLLIFGAILRKFAFAAGLTAIATYLFTKKLWSFGVFAACFIAIVPGYISRSVTASYDNEGIAIFALQFNYYLWVKSVKTGLIFWAALAALSYFYRVSAWGGYVFITNMIPLHVLVLVLMGRYSPRIYMGLRYYTFLPFFCHITHGWRPARVDRFHSYPNTAKVS